jgi:hypothetical protein
MIKKLIIVEENDNFNVLIKIHYFFALSDFDVTNTALTFP